MAGVTVKMGVTGVSEFKKGMQDAKASVKTFDEALKVNEAQLKLNGDQEQYLANKAAILKDQINAQKQVVQNADKALQAMKDNGVDPASKSFQTMQQSLYKAEADLLTMQGKLKDVETGADRAGGETEQMNTQLKNIGKGVSWENVTKGLNTVIQKLESGARAAINFGKKIFNSAKDSTKWADDLLTRSAQTGIDVVTLQQMDKVAEIVDTDVDAIINAQKRMARAATSKAGVQSIEEVLGVKLSGQNADDLFWEIGDALVNMGEAFDKESAAQTVFGRGWSELLPLFKTGREEYEKMRSEQSYLTQEQIQNLGQADDAIKKLEQQLQEVKNAFWAENADKITGLMQWIVDNQEPVIGALTAIAAAFGAMKLGSFALDLGKTIDGFKKLGLFGGGAAGTGGAAEAASAATKGGSTGISGAGVLGAAGALAIIQGFAWAKDQRTNHREQVRGTDENLAAQSGGAEVELVNYLRAMQEQSALTWMESEEEVAAIVAKVDEARERLMNTEGGQQALSAYSDWRQEHSYGNEYWEIPEYLDKMTQVAGETTTAVAESNQVTADMTAAVQDLNNLPANLQTAVENAVRSGMNGVTIVINQGAVDTIGKRISGGMGRNVIAMTK